jgi:hypothetical protein
MQNKQAHATAQVSLIFSRPFRHKLATHPTSDVCANKQGAVDALHTVLAHHTLTVDSEQTRDFSSFKTHFFFHVLYINACW